MSLLAVGLSHRSAPVRLLERVTFAAEDLPKLLASLLEAPHVDEAMVLSTCNRVEVYAEVGKFHGGVQDVSERLADRSGVPLDSLTRHLYVHYEDRVVQHLFTVACGLDSMVVGETQILGQLRTAYQAAREEGAVSRSVGALAQQALRVGKRAHTETGLDQVGRSLVAVGLDLAGRELGGLAGRRATLVGAGSMSALAGSLLRRREIGEVTVVNRTAGNARRLARSLGGHAAGLEELTDAMSAADLVVSCTGATGTVIDTAAVTQAMSSRPDRPLFLLDIALPRDVEPTVRTVDGVSLVDLESLGGVLDGEPAGPEVDAARRIVAAEVGAFLTWQRSVRVSPTVAALRTKAADVVEGELRRLDARLPDLEPQVRAEVGSTVNRVVDKLLHAPTVRVKELAGSPDGDSYAEALRHLFDLSPAAPEAVARADVAVETDVIVDAEADAGERPA